MPQAQLTPAPTGGACVTLSPEIYFFATVDFL